MCSAFPAPSFLASSFSCAAGPCCARAALWVAGARGRMGGRDGEWEKKVYSRSRGWVPSRRARIESCGLPFPAPSPTPPLTPPLPTRLVDPRPHKQHERVWAVYGRDVGPYKPTHGCFIPTHGRDLDHAPSPWRAPTTPPLSTPYPPRPVVPRPHKQHERVWAVYGRDVGPYGQEKRRSGTHVV